jgi:hypothetical protein
MMTCHNSLIKTVTFNNRSESQTETHPILLAAPDAATAILVAIDDILIYLSICKFFLYRFFLLRDCSRVQQEHKLELLVAKRQ